jgi:hypothetical protein
MFLANAGSTPSKFYEYRINNLCANTNLYFSAWLSNLCKTEYTGTQEPYLKFELSDLNGNVLAVYHTGKLPRTANATGLVWLQYGFAFNNMDNSSVIMKIYNDGAGGAGNDFVMDDIEIRLCTPPVTLNVADSTVCIGTKLELTGNYIDDGTFGNELTYRWEFLGIDSTSWSKLEQDNVLSGTVNKTWTIDPVTKADEGYYRLLVSANGNIDRVNCRASSDSVLVKVVRMVIAPDIRVDICPAPGNTIRLTSFLDSIDFFGVKWEKSNPASPDIDAITGLVSGVDFKKQSTYMYKYSLESKCETSSAMAYIHTLRNKIQRATDTIVICKDQELSKYVQLNQIVGLELGGTWSYPDDPDNTTSTNVIPFPAGSKYLGAQIFNARKAWEEASDSSSDPEYGITYKGDAEAKKFVFTYTAPSGSCVGTQSKTIVIIVTKNMF